MADEAPVPAGAGRSPAPFQRGPMGSTAVVLLIIVLAAILVYRARHKKP